ncbi:polyprenyl synthetase family protein [Microbacterium sp. YY-01]|uniref:polyprenyl synthetase family protein n=1 Tax=Microbacterium sp. YY-01 TaxID=3421634 RepID=UPI003D1644BB
MPHTLSVTEEVAARLDDFVLSARAETGAYGPDAARFISAAERMLAGGKRLRARFCVAGWQCFTHNNTDTAALWSVCAALETFQSAALVHDDLIDNSDLRRGHPAAHRAFEREHRESGWHGDAASFGRSAAILLGDLLVAWSDDLLEEGVATSAYAREVRAEYARMRRDVTTGQFLDIAEEHAWVVNDDSVHAERALRVISLKSARYSIEQPLRIGAALAGASAEQRETLSRFGQPLGLAFQLRDDVLGVFGDQSVTGKPSGDDLREGKRTLLIAWTRDRLSMAQRQWLDDRLGDPGLTADDIAAMQNVITDTGALDRVEELIARYTSEAEHTLAEASFPDAAAAHLQQLAAAATQRAA